SACWDHFEKKGEQKAECKHCGELLCYSNGTSRLNRHYRVTCPVRHPKPGRPGRHGSSQAGIHSSQDAPTFPRSSFKNSAAAAEDQLLEDEQFIRFVHMLCPFKMPSPDDARKRCDELFDHEMSGLKDALVRTPGL
uniref:BED-type domain-containing protein n=1 Tax=Oryza brachyantha TaxID=4533 RepID=J3LBF4_ORYBR